MIYQAEIHKLLQSKDVMERKRAAEELNNNFSILKDKEQTWADLHRLAQDEDEYVRESAAAALGGCCSHIPEECKTQALADLIKLMQDEDDFVRTSAGEALGGFYSHIPEEYKIQAWAVLHRLMQNDKYHVRLSVVDALSGFYFHIPEEYKTQAWADLHRLVQDEDDYVRRGAADSLGTCYSHIPREYKTQAWVDLIKLTWDKNDNVRWTAANALGDCCSHIPEKYKMQAWIDLIRLTQGKIENVRRGAANALGGFYSHIPEEYKTPAWNALIMLTEDKDIGVRVSTNHSLGKLSIDRASQAKTDDSFRKWLETALRFFGNSSDESRYYWDNPAKFCLPFYRSFYTLTFKKEEVEIEVQRYLSEAKDAVKGSKSKEKLLEAVENLGNALKEVQKVRDFHDRKSDLNAYRRYCDRACELLDTTEKKAPGVSRLIRRGLPIIDERIQGILEEIREKAKTFCKQTKNTQLENEGKEIHIQGQALLIKDPIKLEKGIANMTFYLSAVCAKMHEEGLGEACKLLKEANEEPYIEIKIELVNKVLNEIVSKGRNMPKTVNIVNQYGSGSKSYIESEDKSINITGLTSDFENLKVLIEKDYKKDDKYELLQTVELMKQSCNDQSKKSWLREKLAWVLTKTSEISSISSLVITLLQNRPI